MGTNEQFCDKVTRMVGHHIKLVEVEKNHFKLQSNHLWLDPDVAICFSDSFSEWVKVYVWRHHKKHVKWDDTKRTFWFVDKL